jgi:hypothetical protein
MSDPRIKKRSRTRSSNENVDPLESEMQPFKKACDATLLLDNIHGAKLQQAARSSEYSNAEHAAVNAAVVHADEMDKQLHADVEFDSPFVDADEQPKWQDWRQAVIARVDGGVGIVFCMRRGDFGVSQYVLKKKNKDGKRRFTYTSGTKHIMAGEWKTSNRFWKYNLKGKDYSGIVRKMREHSELSEWDIRDLGLKPMDFVASDRQIFDHIVRMSEAGKVDLEITPASHFFALERNISCLASWVSAKRVEYAVPVDEDW